ncbi:hypothetical protein AB0K09_00510 [Streptomyces sp. NPDC049577]|uniref:hypothetical protein n=1 Tax=Streptomyces sp. NPDC049577 TaxID=3155153 RepID=UPI0034126A30
MSKGGARTRSGPPPDPNALARERDAGEWTVLPADGRAGVLPPWPLLGESPRETQLWTQLWTKPQALMWERNGSHFEVALYVRRLVEAEVPDSPVSLGTLVRQMADSLGLTTPGMRANRWRIAREEPPAAAVPLTAARSSRARLKVVRDGGV